jgi:hypothetical protein
VKHLIFVFFLILSLTSCVSTQATLNDQNDFSCPKAWTDSLNDDPNCTTKESFGIKINTCWKNDKRHGAECSYLKNGTLFDETNWENGKQNGAEIEYFNNGNIKTIKNYINGQLLGLYKQFFENGNLMFDGYRDGFCHLEYGTCYTKDGTAVPLKKDELDKACYNMLCTDAIQQKL